MLKSLDVAFQECLLAAGRIYPVHGLPGVGQPEGEHVAAGADPVDVDPDITEIDLSLRARGVFLGDKDFQGCFSGLERDLGPAGLYILAHRRI
ncbi:hypothetical protein ACVWZ8_003112 [Arthrobacter sp. UYCu723]